VLSEITAGHFLRFARSLVRRSGGGCDVVVVAIVAVAAKIDVATVVVLVVAVVVVVSVTASIL
jgi:hypothetical protein